MTLAAAVRHYLDNEHEHRSRREPGCRCGSCYEDDPDCGCVALRAALLTTPEEAVKMMGDGQPLIKMRELS